MIGHNSQFTVNRIHDEQTGVVVIHDTIGCHDAHRDDVVIIFRHLNPPYCAACAVALFEESAVFAEVSFGEKPNCLAFFTTSSIGPTERKASSG